jgi:signal transduction histidine kinase
VTDCSSQNASISAKTCPITRGSISLSCCVVNPTKDAILATTFGVDLAGDGQVECFSLLPATYLHIIGNGRAGVLPLSYFRTGRLALQPDSGEVIGIERILAAARVALAVSSFGAIRLSSAPAFQHDGLVQFLLLLYSGHAFALLALVYVRRTVSSRFTRAVHAGDVLWSAVICLFTNGLASPFFLYFIFASLAAAFRWGIRQALLTMLAALVAILGTVIALANFPLGANIARAVTLETLLLRTVYLVTFAWLIGYLAESEKRRQAEALSISQVSAKARVDAGMKGTLQATMRELLRIFDGRELWLVASEAGHPANLWRVEMSPGVGEVVFTWRQLEDSEADAYAVAMSEDCAGASWQKGQSASTDTVDNEGTLHRGPRCYLSSAFVRQHPFQRLLASGVAFPPHTVGRVFMFEPRLGGGPKSQLRFLQQLTSRVAPGVYNVYLLRRLRSRVAAVERARVARELHDGVVQSLHGLAFRLFAMRTSTGVDPKQREELLEMQALVQKENAVLRSLIQQLKPLDFDPRHLVEFLTGLIDRFRYDTGIAAEFVCDVGDIVLPPSTCREIAGIVQEALANVLKHSGAEKVMVRLGSHKADWLLIIEDDGRGFEFSGRRSQLELEKMRSGPSVIRERVRAIGGDLTIDSKPGQGARLEIRFPQMARTMFA